MANLILLRDWQASQVEFWLPSTYRGYDVSNFGRIRSYWPKGQNPTGRLRRRHHPIKAGFSRYLQVGVGRGGKHGKLVKSLHRVVAEVFVPNPDNLPQINHLNGITTDCRADNLEWATAKQNTQHAIACGLSGSVGATNHHAMLTADDVLLIRCWHAQGFSRRSIAAHMGIVPEYVRMLSVGLSWKHLSSTFLLHTSPP